MTEGKIESRQAAPVGAQGIEGVRVDKWLWAVRAYPSRSAATAACLGGHVKVRGGSVKPSRIVRPGDVIEVEKAGLTRSLQVLEVLKQRVGARRVEQFAKDQTLPEVYVQARESRVAAARSRPPGQGRPTKRERRMLDRFLAGE